jgi:predicted transcriptional regulator
VGITIIPHLESFEFLSKYKEFFQTHTTGDLHPKFIRRLGDLTNSNFISGMGPVLENLKRLANNAEEFMKVIITQYPLEIAHAYANKTSSECSLYYVFDHSTIVPQRERDEMLKNLAWRKKLSEGIAQRRMKEKIQVCLAITEKEAIVFFPDLKGNADILSGLFSTDPQFREWCIDYFDHVWESAGIFDESKLVKI